MGPHEGLFFPFERGIAQEEELCFGRAEYT